MVLRKLVLSICTVLLICGNAVLAQNFEYIGAAKCKMCHNKEATGMQFKKWAESAHANAWKNLAGAKALEVGKAKGIAAPQKDQKCLKCHATAAAVNKTLVATLTIEEGVSCETCHGPGSAYKGPAIMKDQKLAIKNGLLIPNEKTCIKCHNSESPTFKGFDYASMSKKIAHPAPKK